MIPRFPKHDKTVESRETVIDSVLFSVAFSTSPHVLYVHRFCLLTEPLSRYSRWDQTSLVDITFCFWMSLSSKSAFLCVCVLQTRNATLSIVFFLGFWTEKDTLKREKLCCTYCWICCINIDDGNPHVEYFISLAL